MPEKWFRFDDPEAGTRSRHIKEFEKLNRREIANMDDNALAKWQSEFFTDEPQWRLAEHEWQRRISAEQIAATMKAARWQAYFGLAGVIIGALLAILLGALK
jgi:hypothetical protein